MTAPQTVWLARLERARAAEALLATLEANAEETQRPTVLRLRPYDGVGNLLMRDLRVYAPGRWYGYPGRTPVEMGGFQYVDWRRDEVGWVDFELASRAEAIRLLRRQMPREVA